MFPKIERIGIKVKEHYGRSVEFLDDFKLIVTFQDGKIIKYDMNDAVEIYKPLEQLRNDKKLFFEGKLLTGYGIVWNEDLDVDENMIYEDGELIGYVQQRLNDKIGVLIQNVREEKGLTQSDLAKLTHINQGDISRLEEGYGNPTLAKIQKVIDALGIDLIIKAK